MDAAPVPPEVDPTRPSVARVYDLYLGGSHRRALRAMPDLPNGDGGEDGTRHAFAGGSGRRP